MNYKKNKGFPLFLNKYLLLHEQTGVSIIKYICF